MSFCAFLWLESVLSWRKPRCIFADPCAHQQFWCRSTRTIWWVHVSLQSWADWQWVQNVCVRKSGFMRWAEELSGSLALEISTKGVYFVLKIWSQPQQSATGTCCNTQVLAKQLVGGWWWKFRAVLKAVHVQPIGFVHVPEVDGLWWQFPPCTWISVNYNPSLPSQERHLSWYLFFIWQVCKDP